jgi:geranylgeranyl diphosphate synthase type II
LALLAGDALIVAAFETVARAAKSDPAAACALSLAIAQSVGMPGGITAGQGWESEREIDLAAYHRAKTGALFVAAATCGALAAGRDPAPWRALGERLGEAYQVADDLADAFADADTLGKPCGQDAAHARPSAVAELGPEGAMAKLRRLVEAAADATPQCPGRAALCELVRMQAKRLAPKALAAGAV